MAYIFNFFLKISKEFIEFILGGKSLYVYGAIHRDETYIHSAFFVLKSKQ
jgi:hypothetical protein